MDYILYGITDGVHDPDCSTAKKVEMAILGGVTIIQYREKKLQGEEKKQDALEVRTVCKKYGIPFLINDDVDLAVAIDADGVHLGQSDMNPKKARDILGPDKIIGVTAKTVEQATLAQQEGANYLGSGAVFVTGTKLDAVPLDHNKLDAICESVSIPVVAIGGIDADNILQLMGRKMSGFAVVNGIFGQKDIKSAAKELKQLAMECLQG